ncbi:hypothetical protein AEGHOMDF_3454 [Methylobacterium soli]|nr:hypothetical protein AEGHOMDF_3454 [Methylobacterium soli]
MFLGQRQEAEPVGAGHALDRHAPISPALRHRRRHRVVGAGLVPEAGGPDALQQTLDEEAGARAGVAVDHDRIRIRQDRPHRRLRAGAGKARVVRTVDHALHSPPARREAQAGAEEGRVVEAAGGVEEMHRREVALAPLQRR